VGARFWNGGFPKGPTRHSGDLFQAGSISKPVAALGALKLVEKGKLKLDENVNDELVSWKLPENEFTTDQKLTLRRLLSHSAGLTVHGFSGYELTQPIHLSYRSFYGGARSRSQAAEMRSTKCIAPPQLGQRHRGCF
jgi:CubicO group peptidase (beta-lactamase class C family)